jgi:hypothetical protein
MRRWTAVALVLGLAGLGALFGNARGRHWLKEVAREQVEDVLDGLAITESQRAALGDLKRTWGAHLAFKMAQFGDLLRRVSHPSECQLTRRYQVIALPGDEPIWIDLPRERESKPSRRSSYRAPAARDALDCARDSRASDRG